MKLFTKRSGVTINVSTEAIVRVIVLATLAVVIFQFIGRIGHQLELIGISVFLALALNPAVSWISRRLHIKSRVRATGLAYLITLAALVGFMVLVIPTFVNQTNDFIQGIPSTISNLKSADSAPGRLVQRYNLQDQVDKASKDMANRLNDAPRIVLSTAGKIGSAFIATITIIVLTFMMLVEGPSWAERALLIVPREKRRDYKELAEKMYKVVTGYVNGQVLIAAIAATFAFAALEIGSHFTDASVNAAALAGIVFLFGLIPMIGNTVAAVIVVIACLFTSVPLAIVMAIFFPIYQQVENASLQPHIQAKNNQLTPLIVFIAALIGVGFGGLMGAFVAIPAAGCLRILLEYRYGESLAITKEEVDSPDQD